MARVRISEPAVFDDVRYEPGDVVEVDDYILELNSGWMGPTDAELTPAESRPKASELKEKEDLKAAKAAKAAAKIEEQN